MGQLTVVLNAEAVMFDNVDLINVHHTIGEEILSRIVGEVEKAFSHGIRTNLSGGGHLEIGIKDIEVKVIELIAMSNERVNNRLESHGLKRITQ